ELLPVPYYDFLLRSLATTCDLLLLFDYPVALPSSPAESLFWGSRAFSPSQVGPDRSVVPVFTVGVTSRLFRSHHVSLFLSVNCQSFIYFSCPIPLPTTIEHPFTFCFFPATGLVASRFCLS